MNVRLEFLILDRGRHVETGLAGAVKRCKRPRQRHNFVIKDRLIKQRLGYFTLTALDYLPFYLLEKLKLIRPFTIPG